MKRLVAVALKSKDPAGLASFYRHAFGFSGDERGLVLGGTRLVLEASRAVHDAPRDVPGWDPRFQHFAIRVEDMDAAMARLSSVAGWAAISTRGPERLPPSTGSVTAFKFRDPDGHPLELLHVPTTHGREAAIDHSAISVADVERSVAFYGRLGFDATSRGVNRGLEQRRLDGLEDLVGLAVDVVALELPDRDGPHLELLHYRGAFDRAVSSVVDDDVLATRLVFHGDAPRRLVDPDGHRIEVVAPPT